MDKKIVKAIIIVAILIGCAVAIHLFVNSDAPAGLLDGLKKMHGK